MQILTKYANRQDASAKPPKISALVRPATSSESAELASELLRRISLDPTSRYARQAEPIVAGWLARGWDARTIRMVVDARMREMRRLGLQLPQTLKYFEREIENIFTDAVHVHS
jgi:hypothetical protein